jgi:hypothetical protein
MPDATHAYRSFPTLEQMAADSYWWPALRDTLKAYGPEIDGKRYIELMNTHRDFRQWYFAEDKRLN